MSENSTSKSEKLDAFKAMCDFESLHHVLTSATWDQYRFNETQDIKIINEGVLRDKGGVLKRDFLAETLVCFGKPDIFTQTTQWIIIDLLNGLLEKHKNYKRTFSSELEERGFEDDANIKKIEALIKIYHAKSNRPTGIKPELPTLNPKKSPGKITEPPPGVKFQYFRLDKNGQMVSAVKRKVKKNTKERVEDYLKKVGESKKGSTLGPSRSYEPTSSTDSTLSPTLSSQSIEMNIQELAEINLVGIRCVDYFINNDLIGLFMDNHCFPNFENCDSVNLRVSLESNPNYKDETDKIDEIIKNVEDYKMVQARKKELEPNLVKKESHSTITYTGSSNRNNKGRM